MNCPYCNNPFDKSLFMTSFLNGLIGVPCNKEHPQVIFYYEKIIDNMILSIIQVTLIDPDVYLWCEADRIFIRIYDKTESRVIDVNHEWLSLHPNQMIERFNKLMIFL